MSLKNYIQENKSLSFSIKGIEVFIKDPLPKEVSAKNTIKKLIKILPSHFFKNMKKINIGQFDELERRSLEAMFYKDSIFITNKQMTEKDMLKDLVHEIAHSVEKNYKDFIYADGAIKKEFLNKRKKMWELLRNKGYDIDLKASLEVSYNEEYDYFLYKKVGYDVLSILTANLFFSPYAATSINEYFANSFENFFTKSKNYYKIKSISPNLFKKLESLINMKEKNNNV